MRIFICMVVMVLCGVVLGASEAPKQVKYGVLKSDEVWSGKVYLVGDVTVPKGVTLEVLPGTQLFFANYDVMASGKDPHVCEILVEGTLKSSPSAVDPVRMTVMDERSLLTSIGQARTTQVIDFQPYEVDAKRVSDEFRSFKRSYYAFWAVIYIAWIIL